MNTFVVVPIYNEEYRAVETVNKILLVDKKVKVVLIDDGSSDNSLKILRDNFKNNKRVIISSHVINLGKGAAMKTGLKIAFKLGAEGVVFMDGDGQHNPKYLPKFIEELNKYSIVFGYRSLDKNAPFLRRNGNRFTNWSMKTFFNIQRKDLLCGFLGFKKEVYKKIKWQSTRYGIETEIAVKVKHNKIPYSEIKIDTIYLDKYKGMTIFDAFKIIFRLPFWFLEK